MSNSIEAEAAGAALLPAVTRINLTGALGLKENGIRGCSPARFYGGEN